MYFECVIGWRCIKSVENIKYLNWFGNKFGLVLGCVLGVVIEEIIGWWLIENLVLCCWYDVG